MKKVIEPQKNNKPKIKIKIKNKINKITKIIMKITNSNKEKYR